MSGGSDAKAVITLRGTASNLSQLNIACRNNADNADLPVAEFNVGTSDKIEFVSKGEVTAVQPACLLTVPKPFTATGNSNHEGGTNEQPISFTNTTTNVNCSTSLAPNATENSGITSISVPSAGTYLVSACISGNRTGGNGTATDQIIFALSKSGITTFPSYRTYPTFVFGDQVAQEFHATFTLPLTLSANDNLCVHLSHIDGGEARVSDGYFSVTKLH